MARARQAERSVETLIGLGFRSHRFAVQRPSRAENLLPDARAGPVRFFDPSQTSTSFPHALAAAAATSHVTPGAYSKQHQRMKGIPHEQSTSSR
jgi:hypothetical protein